MWAGATEGRPDRRLPTRLLGGALGAGAGFVFILTSLTYAVSPTTLGEALPPWRAGSFCFQGSVVAGAPLLFLAAGLLGRTLPGLPWLTGALFGAGAGMTADATWRLMCPVSDPWHVLTAVAARCSRWAPLERSSPKSPLSDEVAAFDCADPTRATPDPGTRASSLPT